MAGKSAPERDDPPEQDTRVVLRVPEPDREGVVTRERETQQDGFRTLYG